MYELFNNYVVSILATVITQHYIHKFLLLAILAIT